MNHLREKYSVQTGFIPNSLIQEGREYHAYDINNPDAAPERVYIQSINENGEGHFDVGLMYETDRTTDFWHLYPNDKVFKEYVAQIAEEVKPKKPIKILGLKKKALNENKDYKIKLRPEQKIQIGSEVIYEKQRGSVIGAIGDKWIVQCQYSTYTVDSKDLTNLAERREVYGLDQFKFDDKTQKVLFEQMVKCGVYMRNVPIRTQGCHVKYSEWLNAKDEEPVRVLVESKTQMFNKSQIRILEDINSFANEGGYIDGVIVDESTGEAIESIMINVEDYTAATGDAGMVKVIRTMDGEPVADTLPKAILSTLSV